MYNRDLNQAVAVVGFNNPHIEEEPDLLCPNL